MSAFDPRDRQPFDDDDPAGSSDVNEFLTRPVDDSPLIRRVRRQPSPVLPEDDVLDPMEKLAGLPTPVRVTPRELPSDPTFGLLISFALSLGLAALGPGFGDLRLVIVSGMLAAFGVGAWLIGTTTRIQQEKPENLIWGAAFGLMVGLPLLLVGGRTLQATVQLIFRTSIDGQITQLSAGAVLAIVIFVLPLGETLFFRGLLQAQRAFWIPGIVASVWSVLLIFPLIDVTRFPLIAVLIGSALVLINMICSYVCARNGLAAAWICQIVINGLIFFIPFMLR